jgi:hypothetical protein
MLSMGYRAIRPDILHFSARVVDNLAGQTRLNCHPVGPASAVHLSSVL